MDQKLGIWVFVFKIPVFQKNASKNQRFFLQISALASKSGGIKKYKHFIMLNIP